MDRTEFFLFIKLILIVATVSAEDTDFVVKTNEVTNSTTSPTKLCYKPEDFIPELCPYYGVETHYREFGCKPIFSYEGACCPDSYDCSHFENLKSDTLDKCHYGGRTYPLNSQLSDEDNKDKCIASCYCYEGYPPGSPARFSCAQVECPSDFGYQPMEPCYDKHSLDTCCPTEYCPPSDSVTPAGCTFEQKTYRDGDKIFPSGSDASYKCKKCICMAGKVECETYTCGMELFEFIDIVANGAVPVYWGLNTCCAVSYIYPDDTSFVVKTDEVTNSKYKCQFGTLELEVGDELVQNLEKCANCTCITPPFITCVMDTDCYNSYWN